MKDSRRLLADYAEMGSETAFRELVSRYIDLVYSTAVRLMHGDSHLAQDVAQAVFLDLARKAPSLSSPDVMLGGWLHRHTCFVAANLLRGERRRQSRERQAVEMNAQTDHSQANLAIVAPILDDAIDQLNAEDRAAIVLRFFEQRDLRSVGDALGSSEEAARKRVSRALEKLHGLLTRRGVALSAAGLATALAAEAVTAAPAQMAAAISTAALAGAAKSGAALTLAKIMTLTKFKAGALGAVLGASITASLLIDHQAQAKTRATDDAFQQQAAQLDRLQSDNDRLVGRTNALFADDPLTDLPRLRAEAASLRQKTNDLAAIQAENRRLRLSVGKISSVEASTNALMTAMQIKEAFIARVNYGRSLSEGFIHFAEKNQGQFPTSFDQVTPFLSDETRNQTDISPDLFEITYQGPSLQDNRHGKEVIVYREKDSWQSTNGQWQRMYAFGDGHIEVHGEPSNDFTAYERLHSTATIDITQ